MDILRRFKKGVKRNNIHKYDEYDPTQLSNSYNAFDSFIVTIY